MERTWRIGAGALLAGLALAGASAAQGGHQHEGDIIVGWTDLGLAGGPRHLAMEYGHENEEFDEVHGLPPVNGPFFFGWLGDEPGFEHLEEAEPDEDFYPLEPGTQVVFEVLSVDEGLNVWTPGFGQALGAGDSYVLGDEHLHGHFEWHIDATVPGVDPAQEAYAVTFRLTDSGATGYLPTGEYTLVFNPEPTAGLLLAAGGLLIRRR